MKKLALIAMALLGCSDDELSAELVDCNTRAIGQVTATKCSPICVQFSVSDAIGHTHDSCTKATFAGSSTPSACNFYAMYLKDENGNDHYGCCASGGWGGEEDFFPGANVPAGELHFYECDRSQWPSR